MSLSKNKVIGIIAILVIALQVAYLFTVYKNQLNTINGLAVSISNKEREINVLKQKLQNVPRLEAQLEKLQLEKNALINQIPGSSSTAKDFSNIMDIAQANGVIGIEVKHEDNTINELSEYNIRERTYSLSYLSTYAQSEGFIRNLNRSYQTVQLSELTIDNEPQKDKELALLTSYIGSTKDLVKTELKFVMFTNPQVQEEEELYDAGFGILSNTEEPFRNIDADQAAVPQGGGTPLPDNVESGETVQPDLTLPAQSTSVPAAFTLNLADYLTSGDNLQFSGPGPNGKIYSGMKSAKEAFVTFTIREDSYDIVIEDVDGKVSQNSAIIRLGDLSLRVNAMITRFSEDMPTIHVYVNNYTTRNITVNLAGHGRQYVRIYNSLGQQVLPGQTSGKVSLVSL